MITQSSPTQTLVLVATNQYGATHRYELKNDQGVFVGKSSNCGLQLHDNKLLDIHCRIGMNDGVLMIQNWISATGTLVNGTEISAEQEISIHDVVQVGSHTIRIAASSKAADAMATEVATNDAKAAAPVVQPPPAEEAVCEPEPDMSLEDTDSLLESPTACLLGSEDDDSTTTADPISTLDLDSEIDAGLQLEASADQELELALDIDRKLELDPDSMDLEGDFFSFEEEETYDRETVALLQAEIEDLRAALAQRDADHGNEHDGIDETFESSTIDESDEVLLRMQELIEEANRSDEQVALLEEMLHAAEDANRSEREERNQLEAWVRDIEQRIGTREEEHAAEIDSFKHRLQESSDQQIRLQKQLRQVAASGGASANKQYEEILENLQGKNRELEESVASLQKQRLSLEKRIAAFENGQGEELRGERAKLAQEQAKISRLRYELSAKLAEIEQMPKAGNNADQETGQRIRALREHLREIHEQEKQEVKETTLATRLSKLWKRTEY